MSFAVNHLVGFGGKRSAATTQTVTWNPSDKAANITLSNGDMDAEPSGAGWIGVRATLGRASGKYYWELYVVATSTNMIMGFANSTANLQYPGQSANGAGLRRSAPHFVQGWTANNTSTPGGTDAIGDVWMFAADLDANKIWRGVNNVWVSGDPAAGTTEWCNGVTDTVYPMVGFFTSGSGKARLVVDSASFTYAAPSGFSAWNLA